MKHKFFIPDTHQVLRVSRSRKNLNRHLLHGHALWSVTQTKTVGITLPTDATGKSHINTVTNKAETGTTTLEERSVKTRTFKAFVRPLLKHACCIGSPQNKTRQELGGDPAWGCTNIPNALYVHRISLYCWYYSRLLSKSFLCLLAIFPLT